MRKERKKWKIYIVAHTKVIPQFFEVDHEFSNDNYCFLNVGDKSELVDSSGFEVINQKELPNFVSLGKEWAESEGIYNIWRSKVYEDLDYIGFLHYDKELRLKKSCLCKTNITKRINRYIARRTTGHISLETYTTDYAYGQRVMYDSRYPNDLCGEGKTCYEQIIEDYNQFWSTSYSIEDFIKCKKINLCSCFFVDVVTFNKMMTYFDFIVKSDKLAAFDTNHQYRFQGAMAEIYFGVFLAFECQRSKDYTLLHHYNEGLK